MTSNWQLERSLDDAVASIEGSGFRLLMHRQQTHKTGHSRNNTSHVVLVSSAAPSAAPAAKAPLQVGLWSQSHHEYPATTPNAEAPTSGVIIAPLPRRFGEKVHIASARRPAPLP